MLARDVPFEGGRGFSARLRGHKLVFNKLADSLGEQKLLPGAIGYANLWPASAEEHAYGVAYIVHRSSSSDVNSVDNAAAPTRLGGLERLDEFEGVSQQMYARSLVDLELQDGSIVQATVYLVCPGARAEDPYLLRPTKSYLAHLLAGEALLPASHFDLLRHTQLTWMPDPAANVPVELALRVSEPSSKPFGEENPHGSPSPSPSRTNAQQKQSTLASSPVEAEQPSTKQAAATGVRVSLRSSGGAGSAALAALRSKLISPLKAAAAAVAAAASPSAAVPVAASPAAAVCIDSDGAHLVAAVPGASSPDDLYSPPLSHAQTKQ
jgi:hypothetical protein